MRFQLQKVFTEQLWNFMINLKNIYIRTYVYAYLSLNIRFVYDNVLKNVTKY